MRSSAILGGACHLLNDPASSEFYSRSLRYALPISSFAAARGCARARAKCQPGRTDVGPGWLQLGACNAHSALGVSNAFTDVQKIALTAIAIRRIIQTRGHSWVEEGQAAVRPTRSDR